MIRRPPRSTLDRSSAAADVYKRQGRVRLGVDRDVAQQALGHGVGELWRQDHDRHRWQGRESRVGGRSVIPGAASTAPGMTQNQVPVSYTHLRAHETVLDIVCRLLLEKKQTILDAY